MTLTNESADGLYMTMTILTLGLKVFVMQLMHKLL
jgi:hypothetical protein